MGQARQATRYGMVVWNGANSFQGCRLMNCDCLEIGLGRLIIYGVFHCNSCILLSRTCRLRRIGSRTSIWSQRNCIRIDAPRERAARGFRGSSTRSTFTAREICGSSVRCVLSQESVTVGAIVLSNSPQSFDLGTRNSGRCKYSPRPPVRWGKCAYCCRSWADACCQAGVSDGSDGGLVAAPTAPNAGVPSYVPCAN